MTSPNPRVEILQQGFNPVSGIVTTQTSEPLLLDTWNTPYAIGPADHALFLSVSPDWQRNLFYDTSGQYGCAEGDGGIINCKGDGSDDFPKGDGSIKARQIYIEPQPNVLARAAQQRAWSQQHGAEVTGQRVTREPGLGSPRARAGRAARKSRRASI